VLVPQIRRSDLWPGCRRRDCCGAAPGLAQGAGLALSELWLETVALVAGLPEAYRGCGHAEQDPQAGQ